LGQQPQSRPLLVCRTLVSEVTLLPAPPYFCTALCDSKPKLTEQISAEAPFKSNEIISYSGYWSLCCFELCLCRKSGPFWHLSNQWANINLNTNTMHGCELV